MEKSAVFLKEINKLLEHHKILPLVGYEGCKSHMHMWLQRMWTSQGEVKSVCKLGNTVLSHTEAQGSCDAITLLMKVSGYCFSECGAWPIFTAQFDNTYPIKPRTIKTPEPDFSQVWNPLNKTYSLFCIRTFSSKAAFLHDLTDLSDIGRNCDMIFIVRLAEKYVFVVVSSGHYLQILQSTALPLARLGKATGGRHMTLKREEWPTAILTLKILLSMQAPNHLIFCSAKHSSSAGPDAQTV